MTYEFSPELLANLKNATRVGVLTGAGVSAESGVPTFRDAQEGLWAKYRPEDLATPEAFVSNPKLVWDWYAWRRKLVTDVEPNPGHYALVELEQRYPEFTLITQNVDGMHQRAGSQNVVELHGNIRRVVRFKDRVEVTEWEDDGENPPRCPTTGDYLRPDVVWFGEMLPPEALKTAFAVAENCDVFFSIGTSALVQPAASLPITAKENGATVIEINPDSTMISQYLKYVLRGPSGEVLPQLLDAMQA